MIGCSCTPEDLIIKKAIGKLQVSQMINGCL
jgi:hypothetical protein